MCWLWFHAWGKWQDKDRGIVQAAPEYLFLTATREDWREIGTWLEQERECARCGKKQLRTVTTRL